MALLKITEIEELDKEEHTNPAGTAFLREITSILDQESSDYAD
jgi:hypothetical protein